MNNMLTVLEDKVAGIGACSLLEHNGTKVLLDCGYCDSQVPMLKTTTFPVPAGTIDIVILTHGHLGHCGLLPILVRDGFTGNVYCTEDCQKIAMFSLLENSLLLEEEKQYWKSKNPERAVEPLYSEQEVMACSSFFIACGYHKNVELSDDLTISFFNAGHSPGSALVKICLKDNGQEKNVLLAGDVGLRENDLNADEIIGDSYDALLLPACKVIEEEEESIGSKFAQIINQTDEAGGNVIIPAFSIDRRDAILNLLKDLLAAGEIPKLFAFVDSPIAGKQIETVPWGSDDSEVYPCIQIFDSVEGSKTLNQITGTVIIIAGFGRGGYGRIGFHLLRNICRPESAVVLFGNKRDHPIWKAYEKDEKTVSILDKEVQIKAKLLHLKDPSVHLDLSRVVDWLGLMKPPPGQIYITHGDPEAKNGFREILKKHGIKDVHVPQSGEQVTL
jgi:metallo-beta-lactamase family protein